MNIDSGGGVSGVGLIHHLLKISRKSSTSRTLSASGPVIATILRIPFEMASSERRENAFMCPVFCK